MKWLKVEIEPLMSKLLALGDAERGRLLTGALCYALDGRSIEFSGNEQRVFPILQGLIDEQREKQEKRAVTNRNNRATNRHESSRIDNDSSRIEGSKEKNQKKNIYISTPSRELKDLDSVDIRDDSLSRDSSMDSTTPLLEKDKAKEPTRSRKPSNTTVLDGFDTFWIQYPKKVAKKDARKAWDKIKPSEELLNTMLAAIEVQKQSKLWIEGYVPNPATWLNGERWNDVVKPMDRLAHLRDLYEQEVANDNTGYGADVRGDSDPVSTGNGFFDFLKSDGR